MILEIEVDDRLNDDERAVVLAAARRVEARMVLGLERYGPLDVLSDERDWEKEADDEKDDLITYRAILDVAKAKNGV